MIFVRKPHVPTAFHCANCGSGYFTPVPDLRVPTMRCVSCGEVAATWERRADRQNPARDIGSRLGALLKNREGSPARENPERGRVLDLRVRDALCAALGRERP